MLLFSVPLKIVLQFVGHTRTLHKINLDMSFISFYFASSIKQNNMSHEFLVTYLKEQIAKHPHLKSEILDFYGLCKSEIEEGGSPEHERSLCYNSVEELIEENKLAEGN